LSITLQQLNDKSYSHLAQKHRKIVWGWGPTFWKAFSHMQISSMAHGKISSMDKLPMKKNSNQNAMFQVRPKLYKFSHMNFANGSIFLTNIPHSICFFSSTEYHVWKPGLPFIRLKSLWMPHQLGASTNA
jgi:hypothetical protein